MTTSAAPRYAGLDGLRAVAVLLVVLYHLFPGWFLHSGFVGVDVFFVISGFLITSLLLRERQASGRIALRAFWTRRARRLLPALAAVVTVSATAAWFVGGDVLVDLGRQVLGAATFSYNWVAVADGASYFSGSEPELFRNLWSLAVEEQFYVLWPLLLPVLLLVRARWLRIAIALVLAAASAGWGAALVSGLAGATGDGLTRAYYGTDSHAFGLLIGVALAFALAPAVGRAGLPEPSAGRSPREWMPGTPLAARTHAVALAAAGVVVLAALVVVAAWAGGASLYPGIPLIASVLSAAAIAIAVSAGSPFGRALDVAPLRWIGERSYGIYLWHWPVVVLLTVATSGSFVDTAIPVAVGVVALIVTLVVSELSYRMLEQPVRRLGFRGALRAFGARLSSSPSRRFGAIATAAAGALVLGGTTAAVAAAPPISSSEAVVLAGLEALTKASATPTPSSSDADGESGATDASSTDASSVNLAESATPGASDPACPPDGPGAGRPGAPDMAGGSGSAGGLGSAGDRDSASAADRDWASTPKAAGSSPSIDAAGFAAMVGAVSATSGERDRVAAEADTASRARGTAEHAERDAQSAADRDARGAGTNTGKATSSGPGSSSAPASSTGMNPASTSDCPGRDGRPVPPPATSVSGDRVTAVGDSVMLASAGGLLAELPGIQIDAAVSRSMWAGSGIVGTLAAQGALRDFVVVGLGTNGPVDAGALQQIYDTVGPQRTLVLVTAFAPRDWIDGVNAELASFAASHPRVVLADWSQAIAPHPDYLAGDQIHPGPTGGEVYATTVADAVDGVENQRAQVRYEVELIRWSAARAFGPQP